MLIGFPPSAKRDFSGKGNPGWPGRTYMVGSAKDAPAKDPKAPGK